MASITSVPPRIVTSNGIVLEPILPSAEEVANVAAVAIAEAEAGLALSRPPSPPHSSSDSGSNTPPSEEAPIFRGVSIGNFNPDEPTAAEPRPSSHPIDDQSIDPLSEARILRNEAASDPYRKAMEINSLIERHLLPKNIPRAPEKNIRDDFDLGIKTKPKRREIVAEELDLCGPLIEADDLRQNVINHVRQVYTKLGENLRLTDRERAAYLPTLQRIEAFVRMEAGLSSQKSPRPLTPSPRPLPLYPIHVHSSTPAGEAIAEAQRHFRDAQKNFAEAAGLPSKETSPSEPTSAQPSTEERRTPLNPHGTNPSSPQRILNPHFVRRMHTTQIAGIVTAVAGLILGFVMAPYFFLLAWGGTELAIATSRAWRAAADGKEATPRRIFLYSLGLRIINTIFFQQPLKFFTHPAQSPAESTLESSGEEAPLH